MKLKPCPFCGGEAEFRTSLIDVTGGWHTVVYVWCPTCEAKSHRVFYTAESDKIEAAERWNTRKPIDKVVEQLEEASYWTEPTYDEDGYSHDDEIEVIDLSDAIEIVKGGAE